MKKLVIGVTATAALGIGTGALAESIDQSNGSGFYLRGEGGYDWASSKSSQTLTLPANIVIVGVQAAKVNSNNKKSRGLTEAALQLVMTSTNILVSKVVSASSIL